MLFGLIAIFIKTRGEKLRIFLSESRILLTILSFMYIPGISLLSYFVFEKYNIYVDMVIVLLMVAFVGLSRRLYSAAMKVIKTN